jgi:hypothetical protein
MYESQDVGPGANIWNWSAMGVSRPLWNLVKGAVRMGMRKEIVAGLVEAIQTGGSVFGGPGMMGAPVVLASGLAEDQQDGQTQSQLHQEQHPDIMVDVDDEDIDGDAEDQLRDDQNHQDGSQVAHIVQHHHQPDGAATESAPEVCMFHSLVLCACLTRSNLS